MKSSHTSNGKKKGDGNPRNGNRYLAWAFVEAANFARRASPEINAWAQRKEARSGKHVIAVKALANKLAKAAYFIMKNKEPFDLKRILYHFGDAREPVSGLDQTTRVEWETGISLNLRRILK